MIVFESMKLIFWVFLFWFFYISLLRSIRVAVRFVCGGEEIINELNCCQFSNMEYEKTYTYFHFFVTIISNMQISHMQDATGQF